MARPSIDQEIDRLYQLPLSDFTPQRNALAKELGGDDGKRIRSLPKPSAPAWAVNQLYWGDRSTYDALVEAAQRLRGAHRAILGGRKADLRGADAEHRDAVKAALASTLRLAKEAGLTVTPATQMEITRTLESLPADDAPGRLAKPLRPEGFEALQGMPIRARQTPPTVTAPERPAKADRATEARKRQEARRALETARTQERHDRAAVARLRKEVAAAERKTELAQQRLNEAQEEAGDLTSELRKAEESLKRSEAGLREAEQSGS